MDMTEIRYGRKKPQGCRVRNRCPRSFQTLGASVGGLSEFYSSSRIRGLRVCTDGWYSVPWCATVCISVVNKGDIMIGSFKSDALEQFYRNNKPHKTVQANIRDGVFKKLQLIDAATTEKDLRTPPGNRFEHLLGNLAGWCSIRVNKQYRLVFQWDPIRGEAHQIYLDPHTY